MMRLKDIYNSNSETKEKQIISYEVFPPKDDVDGVKTRNLLTELGKLKKFNPSLISVTYGAGGSNQNQSVEIIEKIKNDLEVTPMPHFTCVSTDEAHIKDYLGKIEEMGVENILALRGDIPEDQEICHDFKYASELVECIKNNSNLSIAVAGYPEVHKEAESLEKDIEFLKRKVDMGADVIYTQLFFNNDHFFNFVDCCRGAGIQIPLIPGILPVTNFKQLEKMASLCRVDVPKILVETLDKHRDDKDYTKKFGIEYATKQSRQLIDSAVQGLHFYTLNKAFATSEILSDLF